MADDFDSEEEKESGTSLRKKLETTLGENAKLKEQLVELAGKQLITEKGYKLVSVEDLKGVSLSELETKAQELETQKAAAEAETVRRVLASKGLADSELEQAVEALLGKSEEQQQTEALSRIAGLGRAMGTPPSKVDETKGLFGRSRLEAAYAKESNSR